MLYTFALDLKVFDVAALHRAAMAHYIAENTRTSDTYTDALEMLGPHDSPDVAACLIQLLDPGHQPGCTIDDSRVTRFDT